MAKIEEDLDLNVDEARPKAGGSRKKTIFIVVGTLLLLGAGGGAAFYFTGSHPDAPAEHARATKDAHGAKAAAAPTSTLYEALDPPFVVNFYDQEQLRFLQVSVELQVRDEQVSQAVEHHLPVIRNNLVMLFSSQQLADLASREGKEKLRTAALEEIRKVLKDESENPGVQALYFTSFVMQ